MAQALRHDEPGRQLALHEGWTAGLRGRTGHDGTGRDDTGQDGAGQDGTGRAGTAAMCAGCRQREARYGFRADSDPGAERPRTLCFSCFRAELDRRRAVAARLARGWNAEQVRLPLDETLRALTRRRRRAQIAARHALGV